MENPHENSCAAGSVAASNERARDCVGMQITKINGAKSNIFPAPRDDWGSKTSDSDSDSTITYLNIIYDFDQEVAGFQFTIIGPILIDAYGGSAEENGFMVSVGNGIVIGFSLGGSTIPSGSGILTQLEVQATPSTQACITDITLSDPNGNAIQIDDSVLRFDNNSSCTTIGS